MNKPSRYGKWCWSIDEENYYGYFDTEAEAIADVKTGFEGNKGNCYKYVIGKTCNPLDVISANWVGELITEQVDCLMIDNCGVEDCVLEMSKEDNIALGELIIKFIRENGNILHDWIDDVRECTYVDKEKA